MVECRSPFSTLHQLPPSPKWIDVSVVAYTPPVTTLRLWFDQPMDEVEFPGPGDWRIVIDGVVKPCSDQYFYNAFQLHLEYIGLAPTFQGSVEQISTDPLLHGINGAICRHPQFVSFFP